MKNKKALKILGIILLLIILFTGSFIVTKNYVMKDIKEENNTIETKPVEYKEYKMNGNDLQLFDLAFLKIENNNSNKIYSPLSIKYALAMLKDGANNDTKKQIEDVIGSYVSKKYINNTNMSFANALFVKDTYKDFIKPDYINTIKNNYNGDVIYDSFNNTTNLNKWVKDKTLNLINEIIKDEELQELDYAILNALAIDMEWINKIQSEDEIWHINYEHEKDVSMYVGNLRTAGFSEVEFAGKEEKAKMVEVGVSVNKYDIINTLGEDNIRKTVASDYQNWLNNGAKGSCGNDLDTTTFVNQYINEISKNYKQISGSTDFYFYDDKDIKGFAKDLKTYNNTTLQYIGIMPKDGNLKSFIDNMNVDSINKYIKELKPIELSSFDEGYVTEITGYIPIFKFDYELKLIEDLNKIGITDIFDVNKADLSNLTTNNSYIKKAIHKANIDFSNDGIKASAVTLGGGAGATGCGYDYLYEVPIKKIDITFNKPYLFIIRDKASNEVWFAGTVYNPTTFTNQDIAYE